MQVWQHQWWYVSIHHIIKYEDLNWQRLFYIYIFNYRSSLKTPLCMLLIVQQILKSVDLRCLSSWASVYTFIVLILNEP